MTGRSHVRGPGEERLLPRAGGRRSTLWPSVVAGLCLGLLWGGVPAPAAGQVFLTQEEALELAFPEPATIERRTAFLDEEQLERARERAGDQVEVEQGVVTYYVAHRDSAPLGAAYFDAHRVRTMREVVMYVVSPEATIERVEVLKFAEPQEYLTSEAWMDQLVGRRLTDDLAVDRGIVNMTGATLTAGALTAAARRVLALHGVIRPFAGDR